MGKRNFKRKGTYAPKKPRLMLVGERLARLANQPSLNEDADCIDAGGANDEFPTWDSNSLPGSKHSNTSSIAPSSSSVASKKTVNSDAAVSYSEDPLANGSYYVHIPETAAPTNPIPPSTAETSQEDQAPYNDHENVAVEFLSGENIQMAVELLHLCNESQVALHYYDKFLALFQSYGKRGLDESWWKSIPSRKTLVNKLKSNLSAVEPEICPLTSTEDIVPRFSFLDQLKDLLSMPYFQDIKSCCVNPNKDDRFKMYQPGVDEGLSELPCAQWYKDTYQKTIGDSPLYIDPVTQETYHNWLFCLKWYNDKTGVSAMEGSYSLEPLVFTTGILRRHVQESHDAWRHIGFIPSRTINKEDTKKKGTKPGEQSLSFTHECLSILLHEVVELQKTPPLLTINLFGEVCKVRLILEVACVMGDQLSQDTHCCRKKINAGGAGRVHRACMTSFSDALKPHVSKCIPVPKKVIDDLCELVWMEEDDETREAHYLSSFPVGGTGTGPIETQIMNVTKLRAKVSREILEKVFSVYPVKNAWSDVSFGSNENGIHFATVDDPMHYNSGGLFMYLAQIAFKGLKPSEAEELEGYMRDDYTKNRSSVRYDLPRGKFSAGFTNCTLLTASEKVGIIYALYLSLGTKRVSNLYKKSILRQQQKYLDISCYEVSRPSGGASVRSGVSRVSRATKAGGNQASRLGDKYYFKSGCPMTREEPNVKMLMKRLNHIGLLKILQPVVMHFDSLQVEYLLQTVSDRLGNASTFDLPLVHIQTECIMSQRTLNAISTHLSTTMRTKQESSSKILRSIGPVPTVIQKSIKKHFLDKEKVLGIGDTSAILTDVKGFREVLESALIYHSLIHEFHHLDPAWQIQLDAIQAKLQDLLNNLFNRIYRGDNGVDIGTCKCHSHYHVASTIKQFGAPLGCDAGVGERNLKRWAKGVSKTARKCGQAMFMGQTASRVTERLVLARGKSLLEKSSGSGKVVPSSGNLPEGGSWKYTRKSPHVLYDLHSGTAFLNQCKVHKEHDLSLLLTEPIKEVLQKNHGAVGTLRIWKEIKIALDDSLGEHHVRAFHDFDIHGSFFDWAHVHETAEKYCPAKVLLLYQTEDGEDFALVWKARPPTDSERRHETNISARWKMALMPNGLAKIESVSMDKIERCVSVTTHWQSKNHCLPVDDTSMFVIDESYERYAWALNFVDDERWKSCVGACSHQSIR